MPIKPSELILNDDGSIYHVNIKPEELADTIITVGDPDRVDKVTAYFDDIEFKRQKREFHVQTGHYKGKRLTVVSTGIGTDNIDIVFNELDALANIDFETREVKSTFTPLCFIRIGTSGAMHASTPIDAFLLSEGAIGFDSLLYYYKQADFEEPELLEKLTHHLQLHPKKSAPYYVSGSRELFKQINSAETVSGITATNVGFYAPQGRVLRAKVEDAELMDKVASFEFNNRKITNMEMETSGIYAMAKVLGHQALSVNAMIANRATGEFSKDPKGLTDRLIKYVLDKLATA